MYLFPQNRKLVFVREMTPIEVLTVEIQAALWSQQHTTTLEYSSSGTVAIIAEKRLLKRGPEPERLLSVAKHWMQFHPTLIPLLLLTIRINKTSSLIVVSRELYAWSLR